MAEDLHSSQQKYMVFLPVNWNKKVLAWKNLPFLNCNRHSNSLLDFYIPASKHRKTVYHYTKILYPENISFKKDS